MHLFDQMALMDDWLRGSLLVAVGVMGLILIVLGWNRDDIVKPIFLLAGAALAVFGFGVQFFGLRL